VEEKKNGTETIWFPLYAAAGRTAAETEICRRRQMLSHARRNPVSSLLFIIRFFFKVFGFFPLEIRQYQ